MTTRMKCSCDNNFQDKLYGHGVRVFNQCKEGWRCTVCGAIKHDSSVTKPKEKK